MKIIITLIKIIVALVFVGIAGVYGYLRMSLPYLDDERQTTGVTHKTLIERDALGTAIITVKNRLDASYALGFAHGQDRYFQMDLLRRSAAGELSEIVGKVALKVDKANRFHQFRQRAKAIFEASPDDQKALLDVYAQGVNDAFATLGAQPFEYTLTGGKPSPWLPEDSLLVSFSMYLDLQHNQVKRDLTLTEIERTFGTDMVAFLVQTSHYQAALDGSELPAYDGGIPALPSQTEALAYQEIEEPLDIGSNNWAVTGSLTKTGHAMLSDDMHLSLRVPVIWYRAQLNYEQHGKKHQVTGVSLPGTPAVVVGTNGHVAWGFTNANLDNVDWVRLDEDTETTVITEQIKTLNGTEAFDIEMSHYGPVKTVAGIKYALAWVAHQPYAVDLDLSQMEQVTDVHEAMAASETFGMPVQNMMLADSKGNAAWKATGAVTARPTPSYVAIDEASYSELWSEDDPKTPFVLNPKHGRLWTGNSRVISANDMPRYGDGGYALGARAVQIRDRMFEETEFDEQTFYRIQLDNEARFLSDWHQLLTNTLKASEKAYSEELAALASWQRCACSDSVGYTLARRYRSTVIDLLMAPIENQLKDEGLSLSPALRHVEPGVWQILKQQPQSWLPAGHANWQDFLDDAYRLTRQKLAYNHQDGDGSSLEGLAWGEVNALSVKHPFSSSIPFVGDLLNMPQYPGFGDSFMPAVQGPQFGASQRIFVQPGLEEKAILTVPGGQSGHPLSKYYKAGFSEYAEHKSTPLLPGEIAHRIVLQPAG